MIMPKKDKPAKPYDGFPLYAHASGRWAKTIRGKTEYFGKWSDGWKAALERFQNERDDLYAGRRPRATVTDGCSVLDTLNRVLHDKRSHVTSGELLERSWQDYKKSAKRVIDHFGRVRQVEDLRPEDFSAFRATIMKGKTLNSAGNEIGRIRSLFNHAIGMGLIEKVQWGNQFKKPSAKSLRIERGAKGDQSLPADVIVTAAGAASDPMAAMILLGANCGLGNTDCANLKVSHIDWHGGWLVYPRPKTGVSRSAKLWPETMNALEACKSGPGILFRTKYGKTWSGQGTACPVSAEFRKTLKVIGMYQEGRTFYSLRRTFQTVAEESGDFPAISLIMGHDDGSMATRYRQRISDTRLERVAETVREWLLEGLR